MMLAIMTYNTGVFFCVISGLTFGYYIFNLNGDVFLRKQGKNRNSNFSRKQTVQTDRARKGSINGKEKEMDLDTYSLVGKNK